MKLTIHPVRQRSKGRTKVWVECESTVAQAYEIRKDGKMQRRERSLSEAQRIVGLFSKPRSQPAKDRRSLVGKRWADVKDRL